MYACVFGMRAVYADLAKCKNPDIVVAAQRKLVSGGQPVHNHLLCVHIV